MSWLQIVVLAIVQGITEFLPVSSSGHLVLVPVLFGWGDQGLAFDVAVHFGSLLAVCLYFRKDVVGIVAFGQRNNPFVSLGALGWYFYWIVAATGNASTAPTPPRRLAPASTAPTDTAGWIAMARAEIRGAIRKFSTCWYATRATSTHSAAIGSLTRATSTGSTAAM